MNFQISQISEIIEDIKETITDNQYKFATWMDNLMKIHNNNYNTWKHLKQEEFQQ